MTCSTRLYSSLQGRKRLGEKSHRLLADLTNLTTDFVSVEPARSSAAAAAVAPARRIVRGVASDPLEYDTKIIGQRVRALGKTYAVGDTNT